MSQTHECSTAARDYLALGWSVIPMQARGKRPVASWREFQHRRPSVQEVAAWFEGQPELNVGVVTGSVSGIVVLDVDVAHGGQRSLESLQARHGPVPRTVEALTGGGGRHLYFSHPGGTVATRVGIARGLDVRADGGCVVAPPSEHATGRHYRWAAQCSPWQARLAPLPPWLLTLIQARGAARSRANELYEAFRSKIPKQLKGLGVPGDPDPGRLRRLEQPSRTGAGELR